VGAAIFAHHAHVFPESINPSGTIDRLLRMLDQCGIEGAVCFAPFTSQMPGGRHNQWLAGELRSRPRLRGFATLDFQAGKMRDQVKAVQELGFPGIKLHPQIQEWDILDPRAMEVYAAAQDLGLFLTFHSGVHYHRIRDYNVLKFDEVATQFRKLRFSMEHMGGYHFFNDALAILVNNFPPPWIKNVKCNVFAGLASIFTTHQNRFWYLRPEQIMEIILQSSVDQVIFGLDFPYNLERETEIALKTLRELPISQEDLAKILGGNLRRELGI
jgi:predicted TIM-barrel fold metal-dependent hydrolase